MLTIFDARKLRVMDPQEHLIDTLIRGAIQEGKTSINVHFCNSLAEHVKLAGFKVKVRKDSMEVSWDD